MRGESLAARTGHEITLLGQGGSILCNVDPTEIEQTALAEALFLQKLGAAVD